MNKVAKIIFICIVIAYCWNIGAGEKIVLGGLRSVTAELLVDTTGYVVTVDMLPVQCFTPSINRQTTANFAKRYALTAVAKYLKKNALSAKTCEIINSKSVKSRFIADIRIAGVSDVIANTSDEQEADKTNIEKYTSLLSDDLFSRKDDWIRVVDSFFELLQKEIANITVTAKTEDVFLEAVAALDEQRNKNCHSILTQIEKDILLFEMERSEIKEHISEKQNDFVKTVKQQIAAFEKSPDPTAKFSGTRIKKEFVKYLYSDLILMELGGARLFKIASDKYLLISIGSAIVKGNTPRDRIRQQKVAQSRAAAELLKMTGVKVSTLEVSKDKTTIVKGENGEKIIEDIETYLNINQEEAAGWVQMLPEIGSWYSKDKKEFFVALGKFFIVSN